MTLGSEKMPHSKYIFCKGDSLNNAPAAYYTEPGERYSIGHIYRSSDCNSHIGCYAFNRYCCCGKWGVYCNRRIPATDDSPRVIFDNGKIYRNGWTPTLIACYGNGEIWKNGRLIAVYDGPDAGGAAAAALVFGWAR